MKNMREFSRLFAEKYGLRYKDSTYVCKGVFQLLGELLYEQGEDVVLNNFGSFRHKKTAEKKAKHPITGEMVTIPPRDIIKFKISDTFRLETPEEDEEELE